MTTRVEKLVIIYFLDAIGFTLIYFKMDGASKLIHLGNLFVRKVTWFVPTTTSATLILSCAFGANWMTRIAYIYFCLRRTHSFSHFDSQRQHTLTLSLFYVLTSRDSILSLSLNLSLSLSFSLSLHLLTHVTWVRIHSATFLFLVLLFQLDFFQPRTQPQKYRQTPKKTNNQHGRRHIPPRIHCCIFIYRYLARNT